MIMMQIEMRKAHKRPNQPANDPPNQICANANGMKIQSVSTGPLWQSPRLTSHSPRDSSYQSRLAGSNSIVFDELFVGQDDRHDTGIISIETGTKYHAIEQQCRKAG